MAADTSYPGQFLAILHKAVIQWKTDDFGFFFFCQCMKQGASGLVGLQIKSCCEHDEQPTDEKLNAQKDITYAVAASFGVAAANACLYGNMFYSPYGYQTQ